MIPGIQPQPPIGFHPDDVKVEVFYNEEEREFTHPLFAWTATFPRLRKKFFVIRPDAPRSTNKERVTGYRIDHSNAARTTRPYLQSFHFALTTALSSCRGENYRASSPGH